MASSSIIAPAFALALAFLAGSVPTALVLGKLKGIDIRRHGSGNVGATNAARVLGNAIGIVCLLFDVLKGWAPAMVLSGRWGGESFWRPEIMTLPVWTLVVGMACVAGHCFSPWLGGRGGKGVATSLGVFLAVAPAATLICLTVGVALIAITRYVSLASIVGVVLLPIVIALLPPGGERSWTVVALAAGLAVFVVWKHRANIGRLLSGTEARAFSGGGGVEKQDES
ncbi:glycerol-3-phosphate 1-O-acyltransferase PlsY [Candidatus Sumerlaeota bacterium]|nr:glycerol-3-phosphate 1-O-acyltransferase PlsY [Candidatus Sumerlaeota bacterium]